MRINSSSHRRKETNQGLVVRMLAFIPTMTAWVDADGSDPPSYHSAPLAIVHAVNLTITSWRSLHGGTPSISHLPINLFIWFEVLVLMSDVFGIYHAY